MSNIVRVFLVLCVVVGLYRVLHRPPDRLRGPQQLNVIRLEDGKAVKDVLNPGDKPYLALYHGASWCPPCQAFSPTLAAFYRTADHAKFQLVMINYDHSAGEMIEYMKQHQMTFPAIQQGEAGAWSRSTGDGIPNLMIVDTATGKILDSSFSGSDYKGPQAPLDTLRQLIR